MGGHPSLFEKPPPVASPSDDRRQPLYGLLPVVPLALYPSNEVKTENPLTRMIIEKALFPARNTATTPFEDDESNYSFHLSTILFVELLNRFLLNICTLYPFFSILQSIYNLQNHTHDISSKIFYCSATRFRQRRRLYLGMCENEDLYSMKTRVYTTYECKTAYLKKFGKTGTYDLNASGVITRNGIQEKVYQRILIINRKFAPNS